MHPESNVPGSTHFVHMLKFLSSSLFGIENYVLGKLHIKVTKAALIDIKAFVIDLVLIW